MNNALIYSFLNQALRLGLGLLYLVCVPLFLTPKMQGLWFTIMSLGALVIFLADLGFAIIVTQFSAHEFAHLTLLPTGYIAGPQHHLGKLADLLSFCMKQIKYVILGAFPLILLINFLILAHKTDYREWIIPWSLYNLATGLLFVNNILLAFVEGCDQILRSQKIRVLTMAVSILVTAVGLFLRVDLYALAIAAVINSILTSILIARYFGSMLRALLSHRAYYSWAREIYSLLKNYAGSLISSYFVYQIVTLLALNFYGPIAAGKVGLSVMLWTTLMGVSSVWLTVHIPRINMHVSRREYAELNHLFWKALKRSGLSYLFGVLLFCLFYLGVGSEFYLFKRTVSISSVLLIATGWFFQIFINGMSAYIRAHKEEPLLVTSIVTASYIAITTVLVGLFLPFNYFFVGFFSSYLFGLPWVYKVFTRYYSGRSLT